MAKRSTKVYGSIYLTLVITIWVGSAVLIRTLLTSDSTSFNKPFFLTYYNTCFFTVYLIPFLYELCRKYRQQGRNAIIQRHLEQADNLESGLISNKKDEEHDEFCDIAKTESDKEDQVTAYDLRQQVDGDEEANEYTKFKQEIKHIAKISLEFCILWVLSNVFYNSGLASTAVSSSTVLCNTSSIFVYTIGLCLLPGVKFEPFKALTVLFSFGGIVMITLSDSQQSSDEYAQKQTLKGNVLSLLSAACYGLYAVLLKRRIPPEDEENFKFSYFLGFVGLFNMMLLLPVFPILHYSGVETFQWPNQAALAEMTLNAVIGTVISDLCWAKSVVLLGPLLTTLGIAMTIPISMVTDSFYESRHFLWQFYVGSVFILISFFAMTYFDYRQSKREEEEKNSDRAENEMTEDHQTERWFSICLYNKKKNENQSGGYTRVE